MSRSQPIQEGAYTAPDGTRLVFEFEDLGKTIRKRTHAHEFPDVDATYVEDKGLKGTLYPLRVFFSGENYDRAADAFESLLRQRGPGTLDHPIYGPKTVVPFGDIARTDAVVTQGNQTVFNITFWETIAAIYPSQDTATLALVDAAVDGYDAQQFADTIEIADAGEKSAFARDMRQLKDGADTALRAAQDGTGALRSKMNKIDKAINSTLETFVGGPLLLGFQIKQLVGAPARSAALLRAKLDAYGNLAASIVAGTGTGAGGGTGSSELGDGVVNPGTTTPGTIVRANNSFHANRLLAETVLLGLALVVSGEEYTTRREALDGAKTLADAADTIFDWTDDNYTVLFDASSGPDSTRQNSSGPGAMDTGESRQMLLDVMTRTAAYLIAKSFTLAVERSIVTAVPCTAIDKCYELYGSIDRLDEFMDTNELTGDEIMEIPAGRTVRYFGE